MLRQLKSNLFSILIVVMVVLASVAPVSGAAAEYFGVATNLAIALLFFLYGARLPTRVVLAGLTHWRLHLMILVSTFVLFPIIGLAMKAALTPVIGASLAAGLLFLCVLPSTIQSSIAFTSIAHGNVPAAICAATVSNIAGVFITPLLVALLFGAQGSISGSVITSIIMLLLAPFVLGQLVQPFIGDFMRRHAAKLSLVDRSSILMVVYGAFSEAITGGLWRQFSAEALIVLVIAIAVLLALVLAITRWASRACGFSREDEIAIVFCGSKKSLAAGIPMAHVIFPAAVTGPVVLPLMLFHQLQLMVCAVIARRYARAMPAPTPAQP